MGFKLSGPAASRVRGVVVSAVVGAGLIGLVVALFKVGAPKSSAQALKPVLPEGVEAALSGENRITSTQNGKLNWTMETKGLEYYREEGEVRVQEPHALIPLASGGTVEVKARRGIYYQSREDILLKEEVNILFTRGGRREWALWGDTASYRRGEEAFYLAGLKGTLFPEEGDTVGLIATNARYDIRARTMRLTHGVFCRWSGGVTLATDHLDYDVDKSFAKTEAPVTIEGQGFSVHGVGLEADTKKQEFVIPQDVNVRIQAGVGGKK